MTSGPVESPGLVGEPAFVCLIARHRVMPAQSGHEPRPSRLWVKIIRFYKLNKQRQCVGLRLAPRLSLTGPSWNPDKRVR